MRALCLSLSLIMAPMALAQTPTATLPEPPVEVRYQRRTVIDISATTIEGGVVEPSTTALRAGRPPRFKNLIRLRPDFRKELATRPAAL